MSDVDSRALRAALAPFQQPATARSLWELAATAAPLLALWATLYVCVARGWWWGLALVAPTAAFLVRLFMIQHDCGHQAFFRSPRANAWLGRAIGVLTMTPYDYWRRTHAIHHATSGDLDRRGLGAIELLTVAEYRALPWVRRLGYRIYRHPLVLLGVGPAYMFLLQHRLPIGALREAWGWRSVLATNLGLGALAAVLLPFTGLRVLLVAHLPVVALAATVGVWLFYLQHQFEGSRWRRHGAWTAASAAVDGSSYLRLPQPWRWLTANIGVHHVHHLCSTIPYYRMPEVLRSHPELKAASRLGLRESFRLPSLALWNEDSRRMISFAEARAA